MWVDDTRKKLNLPIIGSVKKSDESNYVQPEENSIWMYDIASAIDFANQTGKNIMVFVGLQSLNGLRRWRRQTLRSKQVYGISLKDFVWG